MDWFSVEYSRTMRSFQQADEPPLGDYRAGLAPYGLGAMGYQQLRHRELHRDRSGQDVEPIGRDTDMYVIGWVGNTHNQFRESDRKFYGVDGRITNQSIDGLTVTGYAKTNTQDNSADTLSLNSPYPDNPYLLESVSPQQFYYNASTGDNNYLGLVNRDATAVGVKSRWRPFYDSYGVAKVSRW